ncbi:MAG: class I SAM-dependent methyltransferase, partial [Phycisphaerae bacterium]|nr:class I SAM-dependent methyltransferase [Phycisphaerae bacterium]NIX32227.1 methyltransferase domain-containing protein [Phycisphaerae bacterium]
MLNLLVQHAGLAPNSDVLEIGCGCGRVAFPMAVFLEGGTYTGADIEEVSLESCRKNAFLASRHMHFDLLNVHNAEYNPQGTFKGDLFR